MYYKHTKEEIKKAMLYVAYKYYDISCILFLQYMINQGQELSFWLELIIELLLNPLAHIEGAYSCAVFLFVN